MSTQQDIYVVGSENHPPMLNKDNYVPWSSRLLRYKKSKPNEKLLTDDELSTTEAKQVEADDQAIQTILMGLPEDIYDAVDSCNSDHEIWLRVQQMMKVIDSGLQEKEAKLLNELERFTSTEGESIESYYYHIAKMETYVTLVHQTKKPHDVDYNQLYDYLKQNQEEVNEVRAEQLARTYDPSTFMANTQTPYTYPVFHPNQPSHITYMQPP
ncbi:hypothetical protein Tco_1077319 [Tanacetum coccineum]